MNWYRLSQGVGYDSFEEGIRGMKLGPIEFRKAQFLSYLDQLIGQTREEKVLVSELIAFKKQESGRGFDGLTDKFINDMIDEGLIYGMSVFKSKYHPDQSPFSIRLTEKGRNFLEKSNYSQWGDLIDKPDYFSPNEEDDILHEEHRLEDPDLYR